MSDKVLFPIESPTIENIVAGLNNLNSRLCALETSQVTNPTGFSLSAADRALLDEVGSFFGAHRIVANTLASKEAGISDIDPNTGLARVEVKKPVILNIPMDQTGS